MLTGWVLAGNLIPARVRRACQCTNRYSLAITEGDAQDFHRWLKSSARENGYDDAEKADGLKPTTIRKRIGFAKQFFSDAVARGWIGQSPFAKIKATAVGNRKSDYFITRTDAEKVLEACPDNEWRLLFALNRFGGLRCPSEHLALRWSDVDWERRRIRVSSPKTSHHDGHEDRLVPLFPELRPYLDAAWDALPDGAEDGLIITRYRDPTVNLRTHLQRIIRRAGMTPWPKLWYNLRATRATELAAEYPAHVAAEWLGHSTLVAHKHSWQTTDADFERAAITSGALQICSHSRSSTTTQPT